MNTIVNRSDGKVDLHGLVQAISQSSAEDSLNNLLSAEQWDLLSSYLLPVALPAGQVLFAQGTTDRTLYLLESGSLSVHFEDEKQRLRLAIVGPGSVVGEGAFFSHLPRSATVQGRLALQALESSRDAFHRAVQPTARRGGAPGDGGRRGAGQTPRQPQAPRCVHLICQGFDLPHLKNDWRSSSLPISMY